MAVISGEKCDGDKHDGEEFHEDDGPPKNSDSLEGRPNDGGSFESHVRPAVGRRESVERCVAGVVVWCEHTLETGGKIELPRIVEMTLSGATAGYAFSSYEEEIPIDGPCGEGLHTQFDRIAERLIDLPDLEW